MKKEFKIKNEKFLLSSNFDKKLFDMQAGQIIAKALDSDLSNDEQKKILNEVRDFVQAVREKSKKS